MTSLAPLTAPEQPSTYNMPGSACTAARLGICCCSLRTESTFGCSACTSATRDGRPPLALGVQCSRSFLSASGSERTAIALCNRQHAHQHHL